MNGVLDARNCSDTSLTDPQRQLLKPFTGRLSRFMLVNDILDFSKIEAGKMVLEVAGR